MIIRKSLGIIRTRHIGAVAIVLLLRTSLSTPSLTPADHLVPPPLPAAPQRLTASQLRQPTAPASAAAPAPAPPFNPSHAANNVDTVPPGFMTRLARWFGFGPGGQPQEQQLTSSSGYTPAHHKGVDNGKGAYLYPQPNQQQVSVSNGKAACGNCNKYPWVPMLPPGYQFPLREQRQQWLRPQPQHQGQHKMYFGPTSQQQPKRNQFNYFALTQQQLPQQTQQRATAVQHNFPPFNALGAQKGSGGDLYLTPPAPSHSLKLPRNPLPPALPFVPIPVPNLSASALPPLYNAQPFRPTLGASTRPAYSEQQLPATERPHLAENVGAHSEQQPNSVYPTQIPPTLTNAPSQEPSFEIVKSHQLTDFVSSVEYPTTFVQSQSFDVAAAQQLPSNHKMSPEQEPANTVRYQHETLNPHLSNSRVPASQLLTEMGNFGTPPAEFSTLPPPQSALEPVTSVYPTQPPFDSQTRIQAGNNAFTFYDSTVTDNFPSASSNNFSAIQQTNREELRPKWTAEMFSSIQTDEFYYPTSLETSTPLPQFLPSTTTTTTSATDATTERPLEAGSNEFVTERWQDIEIDFLPSVQTEYIQQRQRQQQQQQPQQQHPPQAFVRKAPRDRETPKRLLDAPIAHLPNSLRPFTRDPSELNFRRGTQVVQPQEFRHPNHAYTAELQAPGSVTSAPVIRQTAVTSAAPTPTSTYGALDASGQYAGLSVPPAPAALPQIIVPYTTRNQPRPFGPTRYLDSSTLSASHVNGAQQTIGVDTHIQQESTKLIGTTTSTNAPASSPLTTSAPKYLTRILAANLRELLKREHATTAQTTLRPHAGFDFSKLQQNIDDWTEQEFTSLSHRPSTPTIRGRSKHIPPEYLTTTLATPRQAKTTHHHTFDAVELPASINNLEPLLARDRGSKRFEYAPIDDNRILDDHYEASSLAKKGSTTSTTTTTTTTTTTVTPKTQKANMTTTANELSPFYMRAVSTEAPMELWKKARVSISPQTQERVYVVTPQPRFLLPQRLVANSSVALPQNKEKDEEGEASDNANRYFKSPRFLVRPTPGNGSSKHSTAPPSSLYSSGFFGLVGLSAYVPSEPVEIIDGNSKVATIITPTNKAAKSEIQKTQATVTTLTDTRSNSITRKEARFVDISEINEQQQRSTSKSTMSPSPR